MVLLRVDLVLWRRIVLLIVEHLDCLVDLLLPVLLNCHQIAQVKMLLSWVWVARGERRQASGKPKQKVGIHEAELRSRE